MPLRFLVPVGTVIGPYRENEQSLGVAAGTRNLDGTVVPAGEIWTLEAATGWNTGSVNTYVALQIIGVTTVTVGQIVPTVIRDSPHLYCPILLVPGEQMRVRFGGCGAGDDIYAYFTGTKFAIELY